MLDKGCNAGLAIILFQDLTFQHFNNSPKGQTNYTN